MANPYLELFKTPGSLAFTLAGLLARLALPMIGIGIITMLVQQQYGYGLAGAVAAVFVLSYALISPQVSRLADQHGQSKVVVVSSGISIVGLILLVLCAYFSFANWGLFLAAVLTGFMPSLSAMVRTRWTMIYRGQDQLQTAYSMESVLDEVTFIFGPPLSVGLCVAWFTQGGLVVAALLLLIGTFCFSRQKSTEPKAYLSASMSTTSAQLNQPKLKSVIGLGNVQLLIGFMIAMGLTVGTIDIVSVAFAQQQNAPIAASIVLSAYAISSCIAGLAFGAMKFKRRLQQLLRWAAICTALTTLPFLFIDDVYSLTAAVFVMGLAFAPSMILAMSLVERVVPEQQLTEAMTWLLAGLNIGIAMGAAFSGQLVEYFATARAGFAVCFVAVLLLVGLAMLIERMLSAHKVSV